MEVYYPPSLPLPPLPPPLLQNNASKALLAVMESHQDPDIIDRILVKIGSSETLVRTMHANSNTILSLVKFQHDLMGLGLTSTHSHHVL